MSNKIITTCQHNFTVSKWPHGGEYQTCKNCGLSAPKSKTMKEGTIIAQDFSPKAVLRRLISFEENRKLHPMNMTMSQIVEWHDELFYIVEAAKIALAGTVKR